ncbi:hypothetical protein RJ639_028075 [Escallonia herrerae]|uniref:C2H2-type domain-containing protein n=1 Tax=Escallonia herrerae TaxID=1293975 RepID=A0AA89BG12_9ASTE|nr:hypothetical protein RJ639_028075 [Escallonia herrerae]
MAGTSTAMPGAAMVAALKAVAVMFNLSSRYSTSFCAPARDSSEISLQRKTAFSGASMAAIGHQRRIDRFSNNDDIVEEDVVSDDDDFSIAATSGNKRKPQMHEWLRCHRVFSSGQALGGHKRCHCLTSGSANGNNQESENDHNEERINKKSVFRNLGMLDLNLPPTVEDTSEA